MKRRERESLTFLFLFLFLFEKDPVPYIESPRFVRQKRNNKNRGFATRFGLHNPVTNVRLYSKKGAMINRCCAPWIDSVQFLHPLNRTLLSYLLAYLFARFHGNEVRLNISKIRKSKWYRKKKFKNLTIIPSKKNKYETYMLLPYPTELPFPSSSRFLHERII